MAVSEVEKAERMSRSRAGLMALAAVILLGNVLLQYGDPDYTEQGVRSGSWIVLIGLWVFILWNGGGLTLSASIRELLNDELSLRNRSRALGFGFYVAVGAALVLYIVNWSVPVSTGDALKIVSAAAVAAALACYAWLEWR